MGVIQEFDFLTSQITDTVLREKFRAWRFDRIQDIRISTSMVRTTFERHPFEIHHLKKQAFLKLGWEIFEKMATVRNRFDSSGDYNEYEILVLDPNPASSSAR